MSKANNTGSGDPDEMVKSRRRRTIKGASVTNSRGKSTPNSRNTSPSVISPNKYQVLADARGEQENLECQKCEKSLNKAEDKIMECQRCKELYCIKCLGKSDEEYRLLSQSDVMWFCGPCRGKVERNIIQDRELEEKCKDIMKSFEERINNIENAVADKCSKEETKQLIQEELDKRMATNRSEDMTAAAPPQPAAATPSPAINDVLQEINRRKSRENNIIIHGIEESSEKRWEDRLEHDHKELQKVMNVLEIDLSKSEIEKISRCGKFNREKFLKDKKGRPLLVVLKSNEKKGSIFKATKKLKESPSLKGVGISNDLTMAERQQEKLMMEHANQLTNLSSGEATFRVRGPPWARRIVKIPVAPRAPEGGQSQGARED